MNSYNISVITDSTLTTDYRIVYINHYSEGIEYLWDENIRKALEAAADFNGESRMAAEG